MKERFLHFIWRSKLFNTLDLRTTSGEQLVIKNVGLLNENAGPDFLNARVKIGQQLWVGNVEIHLNSSQWYEHGHHNDIRYSTVVLHVVWEHDLTVFNKSNSKIPTLALKNLVAANLLKRYEKIYKTSSNKLACATDINTISKLKFNHWLDRLFVERLEMKVLRLNSSYKRVNQDWEGLLYTSLTTSFGLKINSESFSFLAEILPFNIVRKNLHDLHSLEALFLGTAGLLHGQRCNYQLQLNKSYGFLKKKYELNSLNPGHVQFFRLRPLNFPTIRLSQLAALYHKNTHLFSRFRHCNTITEIYDIFHVKASHFWDTHYTFDTKSKKKQKWVSKRFIDILIINVIVPLKYFYSSHSGISNRLDVINLMESLKPERNSIISEFENLGIEVNNALISQSLIQLKNNYCDKKRCLDCDIGKALIIG